MPASPKKNAEDKKILGQASEVIKEINNLVNIKDFTKALGKSEVFAHDFTLYGIPEVQSNVEKTTRSIQGIQKLIEHKKEDKSKLQDLIFKEKNLSVDEYPEIEKEFNKLITKNTAKSVLLLMPLRKN